MPLSKPHYELARVYDDGTQTPAEILPITSIPWDAKMNRRGFMGVGMTAAAVLTALGCADTPRAAGNHKARNTTKHGTASRSKCGNAQAHTDWINALVINPDGKILASGSDDKSIKLWGLPDGNLLKTLKSLDSQVNALAVSPDGNILASGDSNHMIRLWRLPEGRLRATLKGHSEQVDALTITPSSKILASGSHDHTIKLWSLPGGNLRKTLEGHTNSINALAISPDGKILASGGSDQTIKLWGLPDGNLRKSIEKYTDWVNALAITPDGKILASGGGNHTIQLWSLPDGNLVKSLKGHTATITDLTISPDGKILASASHDNTIKLWNLPDGNFLTTLKGTTNSVTALAITPDGKTLASGSRDNTIMLWSLPGGKFKSCLIDLDASPTDSQAITYRTQNAFGRVITFTLPCGSPIPPGAVCTCNCVPGRYSTGNSSGATRSSPRGSSSGGIRRRSTGGTYTYCTCNKVCVCIPVYYCQAHELFHADAVVRLMAEELLLLMGKSGMSYLRWAAAEVTNELQRRIYQIILDIHHGRLPNPSRWPKITTLTQLLVHPQQVIALMAAQLLLNKQHPQAHLVTNTQRSDAEAILATGQNLHQTVREKVIAFKNRCGRS